MRKKILLLIINILWLFTLPGCWDYTEYESLAQLIGIGLDYDVVTQETTVTIQYPAIRKGKGGGAGEGSQGGGGAQWIVHSATDKTIFGAFIKLQEIVPQRLFYGYIKVLVISEDAAKNVIMDLVDLFDRTPVMRSSAYVVITSDKARDIIMTTDPSHEASCEEIHKLLREGKYSGTTHAITLNDFLQALAVGGWEATAPRVTATSSAKQAGQSKEGSGKPPSENGKDKESGDGTQEAVKTHQGQQGDLRAVGMAAFQGDKFAGWLDEQETIGFNWIKGNKIHAYKISLPAGGAAVEELYFRVVETKSKTKASIVNGRPEISVNVKVVGDLRKYYRNGGSDFLLAGEINALEEKLAESVRADVDAALRKGQKELKTDIFAFGFALFREDPRLWQQEYEAIWPQIFPDVPVNISVDAKIINTGINVRQLFVK